LIFKNEIQNKEPAKTANAVKNNKLIFPQIGKLGHKNSNDNPFNVKAKPAYPIIKRE
jgi:hypothetical protein